MTARRSKGTHARPSSTATEADMPATPARAGEGARDGTGPSRIVADDVLRLAAFHVMLVRASSVLNDHYVEVPAGAMPVAFSRRRFTEYREDQVTGRGHRDGRDHSIASDRVSWKRTRAGAC